VNSAYWFEARDVNSYKNGYKVIKNLNIKFKHKESVIILGPNGSGKSSIVDLINRNLYPVENNNKVLKIFNKELIDIWELRAKISTVNNEIKTRIYPNMKVIDLIISGLYGCYCKVNNTNKSDLKLATDLINSMSLQNIAEKKFFCLSDGEKQFALIARALIKKPIVLILDEPTINLDIKSKIFLTNKIQKLTNNGISILCITHDINLINKNFNRVILLKNRLIVEDGNPSKIINSKNINNLFDVDVKLKENENGWDILR
tara:strand:- start:573 stop:1352 length:780 start_codon:yes stop_codon:yes gene_type:complete